MRTEYGYLSRPPSGEALNLFCLPSAGVGASLFARWQNFVPHAIRICPVEFPGRETRMRDVPHRSMEALVGELADEIAPWTGHAFALLGHSMGALVAFELTKLLARQGRTGPLMRLFVSACKAPHAFKGPSPNPAFALPDGEFLDELDRRYGAIPKIILENAELREIFLPPLRADFELLDRYAPSPAETVDVPVTALGGSDDPAVRPADLEGWRSMCTGEFSCRIFPGDHFYLKQDPTSVGTLIAAALQLA